MASIDELELTTRAYNVLKRAGIDTVESWRNTKQVSITNASIVITPGEFHIQMNRIS